MTAKEMRQQSFASIKKETDKIEALISAASKKGELKVSVSDISDAARQYFTDNGFQVKVILRPDESEKEPKKFSICW